MTGTPGSGRPIEPGTTVDPGVFHVGGPCETDTALCLALTEAPPRPAWQAYSSVFPVVERRDNRPDWMSGGR